VKILASLAAALIVAPVLAIAGSASAGEARIAWRDLDLSSAAGAAALDARIDAAARRMCRGGRIGDRAACHAAIRDEAVSLLPGAARVDYARGRVPLAA